MNESHNSVWFWPIVIGIICGIGIATALFADGWVDVLACAALAVPLIAIVLKVRGRPHKLAATRAATL